MSNYNVKLTPNFIFPFSEGDLDSSVLDGKSLQRTINMYEVDNGGNKKMISAKDGETFNNTTFQNSNGIGTFESNLIFTANQILAASDGYGENGFMGVGVIILLTPEQVNILNSYGHPFLVFDAIWAEGSYLSQGKVLIFSAENQGDMFVDVAVLVPEDNEGYSVCNSDAIWNMPVVLTNFVIGGEGG